MALVVGLGACTSAPFRSYAQQTPTTHHHYVIVDAGTFGGPGSIVYEAATRSLNNQGTFTGAADTPNLDPNSLQNPCSGYPDNTRKPTSARFPGARAVAPNGSTIADGS